MPVFRIPTDIIYFPHPSLAEPSGLIGIGGDLRADRLVYAYQRGIFPWNKEDQPLLWWCITPRLVLRPGCLRVSKSLAALERKTHWEVTFDRDFKSVIRACKEQVRPGQAGSWIYGELIEAFEELHRRSYAHSVEVWEESELIGGLYGLTIGRMFCGESMFSKKPNASKFGFVKLVRHLSHRGFDLIDCQQDTPHLRKFGAELMSAEEFFTYLDANRNHVHEFLF